MMNLSRPTHDSQMFALRLLMRTRSMFSLTLRRSWNTWMYDFWVLGLSTGIHRAASHEGKRYVYEKVLVSCPRLEHVLQ